MHMSDRAIYDWISVHNRRIQATIGFPKPFLTWLLQIQNALELLIIEKGCRKIKRNRSRKRGTSSYLLPSSVKCFLLGKSAYDRSKFLECYGTKWIQPFFNPCFQRMTVFCQVPKGALSCSLAWIGSRYWYIGLRALKPDYLGRILQRGLILHPKKPNKFVEKHSLKKGRFLIKNV